jgi:anaerobic magnesium-protoporphyrin IX monomethyl ester cyclase
MRVFLIYPNISIQERYSSDIGHAGGKQIPLGLYYLAAYIRERRHDVQVVDAEALCWSSEQILEAIKKFAPDVVGISATTVAFNRARAVAAAIRSRYPNIINVIGGPHPTAAAADVLRHPEFDYAVLGEGEESFALLLETLSMGGDARSLAGVACRNGQTITVNPRRSYIADIDALPFPAYDLISDFSLYNPPPMNYKQLPVANIITSRGCPNQCTFCGHSSFGRSLRQRSPENIAAEIIHLCRHYQIREIAFVDDTFTINPDRILKLFMILDKEGISFPWTCMSRVNTVDESILRFMKDHGCWHISFGIESGNEDILKQIKKNISLNSVRQAIKLCNFLGILTKGFFIVGHPGETIETIEETVSFALELPLDDVVVTLNTPLPGTEQYGTAAAFGNLREGDWSQYNMWNPVFIPRGLTEETLLAKHRAFYRRFYLRPRIIKRYAMSFLSATGLRRALSLLKSLPFFLRKRPELTGGRQ